MDVEIKITFEPESNRVTILRNIDFVDIPCAANAKMTINDQEEDIPDILRLFLDGVAEEQLQIEAEAQAEAILMNGA